MAKDAERKLSPEDPDPRPWPTIEADYVIGGDTVTYSTLSSKYGIPASTLGKHARPISEAHPDGGDWARKRAEYRAEVAKGIVEEEKKNDVHKETAVRRMVRAVGENTVAQYLRHVKTTRITAAEAIAAAKLLLLNIGDPTERTEHEFIEGLRKKHAERIAEHPSEGDADAGDPDGLGFDSSRVH